MDRRHLLQALAAGSLTISHARLFATGTGSAVQPPEKPGKPVPRESNAERVEAMER